MKSEERDLATRNSPRVVVSRLIDTKSKYFTPGRIRLPVLKEGSESTDLDLDKERGPHDSSSGQPALRKRGVSEVSGPSNPPKKKKKPNRSYAPPETYAHLARLPDYLKNDLDGKLASTHRIKFH
jgi:hypothetical protein